MKLDALITTVLVMCAVVTTGLVVRREFMPPTAQLGQAEQEPILIDNWQAYLSSGVRLGLPDAPVQLIEFADFECPFCATFHTTLKSIRARYPRDVALSYVHYPLEMHRFAEPAARVAVCAGEQGRFEAMHDRLFEEQKMLGLKPWSELASEAGVKDLAAFDTCIQSTAPVPRIEAGKQLSKKLDIQGTPTLIINGWKLGRPPTTEELDGMVKAVLSGKNPLP